MFGSVSGIRALALVVCVGGVSGCSSGTFFPVGEAAQERLAAEQDFEVVRVTEANISALSFAPHVGVVSSNPPSGPEGYVYAVGAGDVLRVTVWDTPGGGGALSSGTGRDLAAGPRPGTVVVDSGGKFFYPFAGEVSASGRSVSEIRRDLTQRLGAFIADPQVEVSVEAFNARRATVTGAVEAPGPVPITNVPVRLVDVVDAAGAEAQADLTAIELRRGSRTHKVNLRAFLKGGEARQNPLILPGDLVYVPARVDNKVFTFGEIGVGEVFIEDDGLTLVEVLARSGGYDRMRGDARGIFVFRRNGFDEKRFTVYQIDLKLASALVLAGQFQMQPLDIVFVTTDPATRWNDTVGKLLSPVQTTLRAQAVVDAVDGS